MNKFGGEVVLYPEECSTVLLQNLDAPARSRDGRRTADEEVPGIQKNTDYRSGGGLKTKMIGREQDLTHGRSIEDQSNDFRIDDLHTGRSKRRAGHEPIVVTSKTVEPGKGH